LCPPDHGILLKEILVGDANVSSGLTDLETGNPLLQTANAILDTGNPLLQTANAILDTASAGLVTFIDKDEAEDEAKGNIGAETDKADATVMQTLLRNKTTN
jgi:exonuclease VII small subunit